MGNAPSNQTLVFYTLGEMGQATRELIGERVRFEGGTLSSKQVGHAIKTLKLEGHVRKVTGAEKGPYVRWELNPSYD